MAENSSHTHYLITRCTGSLWACKNIENHCGVFLWGSCFGDTCPVNHLQEHVLKDGLLMRPQWLSGYVMQLLRKIQVPFSWQTLGAAATWTFVWPLWVILCMQEGNPEYTYKLYLGKVPSFVVHRGLWHVKGHKMAFSSLIPGAGGSYTLTQGHSLCEYLDAWCQSVRHDEFGALLYQAVHGPKRVVPALVFTGVRAVNSSGDGWRAESQTQRLCGSARMFAWIHKSWLPLAVLWGCAASHILIKMGKKGELPQLEQLPCCIARLSCSGGAL